LKWLLLFILEQKSLNLEARPEEIESRNIELTLDIETKNEEQKQGQ